MEKRYLLPLSYCYKEDHAGEIEIQEGVMEEMMLHLRTEASDDANWAEQGGILGCDRETGIISHFYLDTRAKRGRYNFLPDAASLEIVISSWSRRGIRFSGMIHTHHDRPYLSRQDLLFVKALLETNKSLDRFLMALLVQGKLVIFSFERDFLPWMRKKEEKEHGALHTDC